MKSNTGGCMTMGHGVVYGTSTHQKLNTQSSTEAELVAVYDVMPQVLWTRHFLGAQGYNVTETVVYQDNQSARLMETNGKLSSSKRTRHIDIRYFFVADSVAAGEIILKYYLTGIMLADYFTKQFQGALFYKFWNDIMNIHEDVHTTPIEDPPCDDHGDPRSVLGIDTMTTDGTDAELLQKREWTKVLQKGQSKPSKQVK
jgi:hypothetical protein